MPAHTVVFKPLSLGALSFNLSKAFHIGFCCAAPAQSVSGVCRGGQLCVGHSFEYSALCLFWHLLCLGVPAFPAIQAGAVCQVSPQPLSVLQLTKIKLIDLPKSMQLSSEVGSDNCPKYQSSQRSPGGSSV